MISARNSIVDDIKIAEVEVVKVLWWALSIAVAIHMGPLKSVWVIVLMAVVPLGAYFCVFNLSSNKIQTVDTAHTLTSSEDEPDGNGEEGRFIFISESASQSDHGATEPARLICLNLQHQRYHAIIVLNVDIGRREV